MEYMVINVAIVLEMIAVNLTVVDVCSHRKYSLGATGRRPDGLYTGGCRRFLRPPLQGDAIWNGNGLFVLAGFLYLIPINWLYEESCRRILTVVCTSWIYTMLVFCISPTR